MLFNGKYKVLTTVFDNSIIESEIIDYTKNISKTIIDTQEQQVREALISLGWKPPEEKETVMNTFHKYVDAQEKRSYLLRLEEDFGICKNCGAKTNAYFSKDKKFLFFECGCGNYKKRIEL